MNKLTTKQQTQRNYQRKILKFIIEWLEENESSPTLGDIVKSKLGIHKSTASKSIKELVKDGYLTEIPFKPSPRELKVTDKGKKYIEGAE